MKTTMRILAAIQKILLLPGRDSAAREAQLRFNVFLSREIPPRVKVDQ
jgi:hypothetical protein